MNPKQERTVLFFLSVFLLVVLVSNIVNAIIGDGTINWLMIACFAGGLICTVIAWVQNLKGNKEE